MWNGSVQSVLLDTTLNISSFDEDEQGELYVVGLGGTISKIVATAPCTYSISPTRTTFPAAGGSGSVTLTTGAGCPWTAASNASWITITSAMSGSGNAVIDYTVATYTGRPKNRNGTMTIAGLNFSVKQSK